VIELDELAMSGAPAVRKVVALWRELRAGAAVTRLGAALGRELLQADGHGRSTSSGMCPSGSSIRDSQKPATNRLTSSMRPARNDVTDGGSLAPLEGFVVGVTANRRSQEQAALLRHRVPRSCWGP
jgi:hypothetical protein